MRVFLPDLAPFRDLTLEGVTPVYYSRDALPEGGADGFVLWFLPEAQRRELLSRPGLKWVLTLTAGIDHVVNDLPDGVQLFNAHALHDRAVAQHALALMLAAGRACTASGTRSTPAAGRGPERCTPWRAATWSCGASGTSGGCWKACCCRSARPWRASRRAARRTT